MICGRCGASVSHLFRVDDDGDAVWVCRACDPLGGMVDEEEER